MRIRLSGLQPDTTCVENIVVSNYCHVKLK